MSWRQASRQGLASLAGGAIRGEEVSIQAGSVDNTGYLIADNTLSISAQSFLNRKRNAEFGHYTESVDRGYMDSPAPRWSRRAASALAASVNNVDRACLP